MTMENNGQSRGCIYCGLKWQNGRFSAGSLYCTIWALAVVSFRALMALTILFLVLLVEGWGEKVKKVTHLIIFP